MSISMPTLILGAVLATLYGALFHLWRGGKAGKLLLYLVLSWIGFWGGHLLASYLGLNILKIGGLQLAAGTIGSAVFLLLGAWLSPVKRE